MEKGYGLGGYSDGEFGGWGIDVLCIILLACVKGRYAMGVLRLGRRPLTHCISTNASTSSISIFSFLFNDSLLAIIVP
jgi:hypothetical protein